MKLILAHGCFDLTHLGHIRHLRQAKAMGDKLIVTVTPDAAITKGTGRPVFTAQQRVEALFALWFVDLAFESTALDAIRTLRPWLYVKGPECRANQTPGLLAEIDAVRACGGDIAYTDGEVFSSTEIMQRILDND